MRCERGWGGEGGTWNGWKARGRAWRTGRRGIHAASRRQAGSRQQHAERPTPLPAANAPPCRSPGRWAGRWRARTRTASAGWGRLQVDAVLIAVMAALHSSQVRIAQPSQNCTLLSKRAALSKTEAGGGTNGGGSAHCLTHRRPPAAPARCCRCKLRARRPGQGCARAEYRQARWRRRAGGTAPAAR